MKIHKKTLKAMMLSATMATLMLLPLTMNGQYNEHKSGIQPWGQSSMLGRENKYGLQEWGQTSLMGRQDGGGTRNGSGGIGLEGTTPENPTNAPLGSGIAILVVAGVGYTLLKRKEDMQ